MGIHNFRPQAAHGRGTDAQVPFLKVVCEKKEVITENVGLKRSNDVNTHVEIGHC